MFKMRPVLRYASRKVREPRVKNVHCPSELERAKPDRITPMTFFPHVRASNLAPRYGHEPRASAQVPTDHTCRPKPLEPYAERLLASRYPIRQLGCQKGLEFIFRVATNKRSDQTSSRGTGDDTRKEVRIQKRLDHPEMIYTGCELAARTTNSATIAQYPNEAPPERQRAVAPRLVLMLR